MALIAACGSNQRQIITALVTYASDSDGKLPLGSGYSVFSSVPNRGVEGSGDFWDQLFPDYLPAVDTWYCPDGGFFADSRGLHGNGTMWNFRDPSPPAGARHANLNYAILSNAYPIPNHYENLPSRLSDPPDLVLTLDFTIIQWLQYYWVLTNHPGTTPAWMPGWTGPEGSPPLGVNNGRLDGSVRWVPEEEAVPSYPGGGGNPMSLKWRLIE